MGEEIAVADTDAFVVFDFGFADEAGVVEFGQVVVGGEVECLFFRTQYFHHFAIIII